MDIEKQYPSLKKMGHIRFKEKRKSYLGRYKGTVSAILQMKQFSVGLFLQCNLDYSLQLQIEFPNATEKQVSYCYCCAVAFLWDS